jgi:sugar O-acyltransferase (sialic acid O-acetyltransferase NeuD family)
MSNSKVQKIVFLGASTAVQEVTEIIKAINKVSPTFEVIAILDDNKDTHGKVIRGIQVLGDLSLVHTFDQEVKFIFGIGSLRTRLIRQNILKKIGLPKERFVTIIHPRVVIDESAHIGYGCIIHPGVCIGNDAIIDSFAIVAVNSAIGPFAHIRSFAMVTSLVVILSNAKIGKAVFVGSCSCVTENVEIGDGSMIGAGTVVSRNVDTGCFFLGNPARLINRLEVPEELISYND